MEGEESWCVGVAVLNMAEECDNAVEPLCTKCSVGINAGILHSTEAGRRMWHLHGLMADGTKLMGKGERQSLGGAYRLQTARSEPPEAGHLEEVAGRVAVNVGLFPPPAQTRIWLATPRLPGLSAPASTLPGCCMGGSALKPARIPGCGSVPGPWAGRSTRVNEAGRSQKLGKAPGEGAWKTVLFELPDLGGPT